MAGRDHTVGAAGAGSSALASPRFDDAGAPPDADPSLSELSITD